MDRQKILWHKTTSKSRAIGTLKRPYGRSVCMQLYLMSHCAIRSTMKKQSTVCVIHLALKQCLKIAYDKTFAFIDGKKLMHLFQQFLLRRP